MTKRSEHNFLDPYVASAAYIATVNIKALIDAKLAAFYNEDLRALRKEIAAEHISADSPLDRALKCIAIATRAVPYIEAIRLSDRLAAAEDQREFDALRRTNHALWGIALSSYGTEEIRAYVRTLRGRDVDPNIARQRAYGSFRTLAPLTSEDEVHGLFGKYHFMKIELSSTRPKRPARRKGVLGEQRPSR